MSQLPYLQVEQLSKRFAENYLFQDISFTIFKDQKIALIAKNGAGKSTLMEILAGNDVSDSGQLTITNGVKIGYLRQHPDVNPNITVLEQALLSNNPALEVVQEFEQAIKQNNQSEIERLTVLMEEHQAWDFEVRVKQILSQLKIENFNQKVGELSGGQQKRVALANVLLNEPDLLMLDEPTNHLDLEMIEWLEQYLAKSKCTLFMITHDRYFLDRVCNEIIEIDDNQVYSYKGNYSYYLGKREERIAQLQASTEKAQNLYRTELEWMRRMPKARSHKAKYRIDQFHDLKKKAGFRIQEDKLELGISSARMGSKILELENISKSYGDLNLINNFTYKFQKFEKIGIVGKNGTGKSTFLNVITNQIAADTGNVDWGQTINIGYYKQTGIDFSPADTLIEVVKEIAEVITFADGSRMTASQLLTRFLFPPETQHSLIEKLSGGEKRRLYLCTILMQNPNFLILDEPTNDLDIMTLNVLEDYLSAFGGCVVVVSHDRYFMDKIVDHLFVFDGNGQIKDFPGNYSIYRNWADEQEELRKGKTSVSEKSKVSVEKPKKKNVIKLTFKEKRELEQLELDIIDLEEEKEKLENLMNSGELSSQELLEKSTSYASLKEELDKKELRWLELSEKV
ncbi:MAG: ABC-F family ATP-binding cassette domain-containing protein [Mangrovibacterium sp.]